MNGYELNLFLQPITLVMQIYKSITKYERYTTVLHSDRVKIFLIRETYETHKMCECFKDIP